MKPQDIFSLVNDIKNNWNTNDPYEIAKRLGIEVLHRNNCLKEFTAHTIKIAGYPTIISINDDYTDFSKKLLCAHELGHALLHENCINHFAGSQSTITTNIELEANLFAISLLSNGDLDKELSIPLAKMDNYLLKSIIDYNLKKK